MQPTHASNEAPQLVLNRTKLNELRRAHSIDSEAELARRIGVAASTLWRISEGKVQPSTEFIARVMVAFPTARMDDLFSVQRAVAVAS
jgi:DNA-binding XRE family transcriptional regulator